MKTNHPSTLNFFVYNLLHCIEKNSTWTKMIKYFSPLIRKILAIATLTTALYLYVTPIWRRKTGLDQGYPQQAEEAKAEMKYGVVLGGRGFWLRRGDSYIVIMLLLIVFQSLINLCLKIVIHKELYRRAWLQFDHWWLVYIILQKYLLFWFYYYAFLSLKSNNF